MPAKPIVLDTNIVLDVFVFNDAAALPVRQALEAGELDWLAYPQIAPRLESCKLSADDVLAAFDRYARSQKRPPKPASPAATPTTRSSSTWRLPTTPCC